MKGWKIGGVVGFLIPWIAFYYKINTCIGTMCGDLGMGVPIIFIFSIIGVLVGMVLGKILSK